MTGGGAENWCTFHMPTAPTVSATTATTGIHTRASMALPTERGLTRSPSQNSVPAPGLISSRLTYERVETSSTGWGRACQVGGGLRQDILRRRRFNLALLRSRIVKLVAANMGNTPRNVRSE